MERTTQKAVSPDIDSVCARLDRMQQHGYFAEPRNVSNVWCHVSDDGHFVDLVMLGDALSRMSEKGTLLRTLMPDGLLSYVNKTNAGHWQSIDMPAAEDAPGTDAAGTTTAH